MKPKNQLFKLVVSAVIILLLSAGMASAQTEITIDVAPNVLNIASEGTVVTVHTDIAYSAVEGASVQLNGIDIAWWKSDSRGQFVAKFNMEEVTELVTHDILELGDITLTLTGESTLGAFSGSQVISVIDVESKGK